MSHAMFLDDRTIWPRPDEPSPATPPRYERVLGRMLLFYAFVLLLMPISLGSLVDMVRYLIGLLD